MYWLTFIFCAGYVSPLHASLKQTSTVYFIEESKSIANTLTVHVTRANSNSGTQLILRGVTMGITKQVQNVVCDNKQLKENKVGIWQVPAGCQKLRWQVPLAQSGNELASAQQSLRFGDFILFSEISSLPRLQDATSEYIKIAILNVKTIFPKPSTLNEIKLPNIHSAPFFLMLNPTIVGTKSSNAIKLTYFADNQIATSKLPNLSSHMIGLKWLNTIVPGKTEENFNIAWLGIPAKKVSLAGATGTDILLTNYPNNGKFSFGQAMLLYVTLHEAFHQLSSNYSEQPIWVSESLASYYGIRALQFALPNDANAAALIEKFIEGANQYKAGLITINRKVQEGDRSVYGAFYTKGIAFWMAVDNALRQTQNDNLDNRLLDVFRTKYDVYGEPIDLQKSLKLSPATWSTLRRLWLD